MYQSFLHGKSFDTPFLTGTFWQHQIWKITAHKYIPILLQAHYRILCGILGRDFNLAFREIFISTSKI